MSCSASRQTKSLPHDSLSAVKLGSCNQPPESRLGHSVVPIPHARIPGRRMKLFGSTTRLLSHQTGSRHAAEKLPTMLFWDLDADCYDNNLAGKLYRLSCEAYYIYISRRAAGRSPRCTPTCPELFSAGCVRTSPL